VRPGNRIQPAATEQDTTRGDSNKQQHAEAAGLPAAGKHEDGDGNNIDDDLDKRLQLVAGYAQARRKSGEYAECQVGDGGDGIQVLFSQAEPRVFRDTEEQNSEQAGEYHPVKAQ
jgi:hypothetical protein